MTDYSTRQDSSYCGNHPQLDHTHCPSSVECVHAMCAECGREPSGFGHFTLYCVACSGDKHAAEQQAAREQFTAPPENPLYRDAIPDGWERHTVLEFGVTFRGELLTVGSGSETQPVTFTQPISAADYALAAWRSHQDAGVSRPQAGELVQGLDSHGWRIVRRSLVLFTGAWS